MRLRLSMPLLALALLGGCAPARLDPAAPPEEQVLFMLRGLGAAMESNELQKILPYFADDTQVVVSGQRPATGREALTALLKGIQAPIEQTRITPLATLAEADGVRQTGILRHTVQLPTGKRGTVEHRFEAFWVKGQDGLWRIRRWEVASAR